MKIRYGVARVIREPHRRKKIEQRNFKMESDGLTKENFLTDEGLRIVLDHVRDRHPGWSLAGYCEDR